MNIQNPNVTGPALADVYPPYRDTMEAYNALVEAGKTKEADALFHMAQLMGAAFWAGAEYQRGLK
jgi:hypothetical protein